MCGRTHLLSHCPQLFWITQWTDTQPVSEQHIQPCGGCCSKTCYWPVSLLQSSLPWGRCSGLNTFSNALHLLPVISPCMESGPERWPLIVLKYPELACQSNFSGLGSTLLCQTFKGKSRQTGSRQRSAELNTILITMSIAHCAALFFS